MKASLVVSVLLGVVACVSAGGYGGGGVGHGHGFGYQQFAVQRPVYYQLQQQPVVTYGVQGFGNTGGSNSGNLFGGYGGGGYGGGLGVGSNTGSIIPIIIIFVLLAIFAPLLIASLTSSNDAFYDSIGSK
ncbi:glycine-rich protein-like [Saccostrea echinata]|uniref:glycine-rich protein-like n=1 Tax=Saccostrea echinata TaxID=191078 RepID=UPI002A8215D6|nr:glycine-rich protein-like [Saccostrea echinata]